MSLRIIVKNNFIELLENVHVSQVNELLRGNILNNFICTTDETT